MNLLETRERGRRDSTRLEGRKTGTIKEEAEVGQIEDKGRKEGRLRIKKR